MQAANDNEKQSLRRVKGGIGKISSGARNSKTLAHSECGAPRSTRARLTRFNGVRAYFALSLTIALLKTLVLQGVVCAAPSPKQLSRFAGASALAK
jgi:hypothetical protein